MAVAVQCSTGDAHAFKITDNGPLVSALLISITFKLMTFISIPGVCIMAGRVWLAYWRLSVCRS